MQTLSWRVDPHYPPDDFVTATRLLRHTRVELRYCCADNFTGKPVPGYENEVLIMTDQAARALQGVEKAVKKQGLGLLVFDAYRPQRAVDAFMRWAGDSSEHDTKEAFYPTLNKSQLVPLGYLMPCSSHSRGSTVDLTLVDLASGKELDMGTPFDFFDPRSWPLSDAVTAQQRANRMLLREAMLDGGFMPLETEWWHFTLRDEPYPETWFDFPVA